MNMKPFLLVLMITLAPLIYKRETTKSTPPTNLKEKLTEIKTKKVIRQIKSIHQNKFYHALWIVNAARDAIDLGHPDFNVREIKLIKRYDPLKRQNGEVVGVIEFISDPMEADFNAYEILSHSVPVEFI